MKGRRIGFVCRLAFRSHWFDGFPNTRTVCWCWRLGYCAFATSLFLVSLEIDFPKKRNIRELQKENEEFLASTGYTQDIAAIAKFKSYVSIIINVQIGLRMENYIMVVTDLPFRAGPPNNRTFVVGEAKCRVKGYECGSGSRRWRLWSQTRRVIRDIE